MCLGKGLVMQCMLCSREIDGGISYYIGKKHGFVCSNCKRLLGLKPHPMFDVEIRTPEEFVLWLKLPKDENEKAIVECAWMNDGRTVVRSESITGKPIDEVLELLYRLHDEHKYLCISCGKEVDANKNTKRHFAGVYCEKCWEEYKKRNSWKCPKCGNPAYMCYC